MTKKRKIAEIKYPVKASSREYVVAERQFDLESRTKDFAIACIDLCKRVSKSVINAQLIGQLVRASGSVGANYREANEAVTRKDFYYRIGICRKEAKETRYWLELLRYANCDYVNNIDPLMDEALQLARIFAAISIRKS